MAGESVHLEWLDKNFRTSSSSLHPGDNKRLGQGMRGPLEEDSAVNTGWTISGQSPWEREENRRDGELRSGPGQGEGARKIDNSLIVSLN